MQLRVVRERRPKEQWNKRIPNLLYLRILPTTANINSHLSNTTIEITTTFSLNTRKIKFSGPQTSKVRISIIEKPSFQWQTASSSSGQNDKGCTGKVTCAFTRVRTHTHIHINLRCCRRINFKWLTLNHCHDLFSKHHEPGRKFIPYVPPPHQLDHYCSAWHMASGQNVCQSDVKYMSLSLKAWLPIINFFNLLVGDSRTLFF